MHAKVVAVVVTIRMTIGMAITMDGGNAIA
jgi:hypothetical protein